MPNQTFPLNTNGLFNTAHFYAAAEGAFIVAMMMLIAYFAICTLWLWRLLIAALSSRLRPTQSMAVTAGPGPRFVIIVPAHDEELVLEAALSSLQGLDYPPEAFHVVLVADNCTDQTDTIGRRAGITVLVRTNPLETGKGYALEYARRWLVGERHDETPTPPEWDALVVLDADTIAAPNLLRAFASHLNSGEQAMQARYDVLNTQESWRTRLMAAALALNHVVKPLGRERLGLSDGLKGNGMAFSRAVVERFAWPQDALTEDIAYTLILCRAGVRVAFVPETRVQAQMPTTGVQAAPQRRRWEEGRYHLMRSVAPDLLWQGIRNRDRIVLDRAFDLLIPPFAERVAIPTVLLAVCLLSMSLFSWHGVAGLSVAWVVVLALEAGYLALGLRVAGVSRSVVLSVLFAPVYIVWKFSLYALSLLTGPTRRWQRTQRR
jgi:1,2-diacylglycerol 3-beta-glucosyltransferase